MMYETCIYRYEYVIRTSYVEIVLQNTHLHSSSILFQAQAVLLPYTRLGLLVHVLQSRRMVLFRRMLLLLDMIKNM